MSCIGSKDSTNAIIATFGAMVTCFIEVIAAGASAEAAEEDLPIGAARTSSVTADEPS